MATNKSRRIVAGSTRRMLTGATLVGDVDSTQRITITVLVRPRSKGDRPPSALASSAAAVGKRRYLARADFGAERGADPADLTRIEQFAHQHNLTVAEASVEKRAVKLEGTIADLTAAFRPKLKSYRIGRRIFRGRTGGISVPEELAGIVVAVLGFDNRPALSPHCRFLDGGPNSRRATGAARKKAQPQNAADGSFTPPQVAQLYHFPTGLDGSGQCIALIELNDADNNGRVTGTGFSATDLTAYFKKLKLPKPQVTAVGVDGGANKPGTDPNADGEVMLDIEVAGAIAPGAKIAVYFAPNTDQGFVDAVGAALHDDVRKPSVISISWGGPENSWTDQSLLAFDQMMQDAASLGVTVCCAAGDNGSSDLPLTDGHGNKLRDGKPHADFPASSPYALACGGTKLIGSGTTIASEAVWNEGDRGGASGGGVSDFFERPSYQSKAKVPKSPQGKTGRGLPDVAGDADPATGYQVRVSGSETVIGGTSAVAPLWAALIARINQRLAKLDKPSAGFVNPILYGASAALRDIVQGNNDIDGSLHKYQAKKGWDACTGLGTPDGVKVMQALGG